MSHRTRHALAAACTLGVIVLSASACTTDGGDSEAVPTVDTTPSTSSEPTTTNTSADPALGGGDPVDIRTYETTWLITTAEGAVTTIDDPALSEVPSDWTLVAAGTDAEYLVRSGATTDGQEMCLTLPGDDVVGVEVCDPASADQQFRVVSLDQPEQVNISNENGYLVSDPEGGVAVQPDPSSPASVFTLVPRA